MAYEGTIQAADVPAEQKEKVLTQRDRMLEAIDSQVESNFQQMVNPAKPTEEQILIDDPQRVRVKVKIDGEEREMVLAEVVAGYQKNEVASERLRQASHEKLELEKRRQQLQELEAEINRKAAAKPATEAAVGEGEDDLAYVDQAAAKLLEDGDPAELTKLLKEMVAKGRQATTPAAPAIDTQQIVEQVKTEIETGNIWKDFLTRNPVFQEQYDDQGTAIYTPERLEGDALFAREMVPQIQAGTISYRAALDETARKVAEKFAQKAEAQPNGLEARQKSKAAIDNLPAMAAIVATGGSSDEREPTASEIIAQMKKDRGGV